MQRLPLFILLVAILLGSFSPANAGSQTPTALPGSPLMSLLDLLPDTLSSDGQIQYASYALQLEVMGVEGPGAELDAAAWLEAVHVEMIPLMFTAPVAPEWREGLGLDLRDVDALVELKCSGTSITIMQGRMNTALLPAVWEASGYSPVETNGVTWYTLGEDHALIFERPMHSMHLGKLSHLVALDDGIVVGTATRADMEAVIAIAGGEGSSFADGRGAVFQQAPNDLAAAYIVDGSTFVATVDPIVLIPNNPNVPPDVQDRLATQVAQIEQEAPRMPPIYTALIGISSGAVNADQAAGGAPRSNAILAIVPLDDAATEVVAETVTRRLTTMAITSDPDFLGQPYSSMFDDMVIETSPEYPVVLIELTPIPNVPATIVIRMFESRQLTFLTWAP